MTLAIPSLLLLTTHQLRHPMKTQFLWKSHRRTPANTWLLFLSAFLLSLSFWTNIATPATAQKANPSAPTGETTSGDVTAEPVTKGQRVFSCGHSFHAFFITPIMSDMAKGAGIEGHEIVGVSKIGGSRVIQHWNVPDEKNQAKAALKESRIDVLTLSPMHTPDDGIDKFAELAFQHNPNVRVTIQEFWIPWDKNEWPFTGKQDSVDFDAAKIDDLRKMHEPYFKTMDEYVSSLNKKLGKQVLFVVPMGQAVLALREKIIAGEAPGIEKQSELFTDKLGHPKPTLEALEGYCHFAVIYRRSPVGLPMPEVIKNAKNPQWDEKLNRLLQELAWDAVTQHPLSGVKAAPAGKH